MKLKLQDRCWTVEIQDTHYKIFLRGELYNHGDMEKLEWMKAEVQNWLDRGYEVVEGEWPLPEDVREATKNMLEEYGLSDVFQPEDFGFEGGWGDDPK